MTPQLPTGHRFRRFFVGLAAVLACLLVVACATKQFEPDFATYSEAYAQNQNWQMLLNIARLDQGYPSYFLVIGAIHLLRNQTGSLQAGGTTSHTAAQTITNSVSRTVTNVLSGTLTPNASTNVQPSFDFIPINSTEAAQQLLAPISIDAFNTLYQQGWPVDQLLRVMVERIEVDFYDKEGNDTRLVLTNSPTRAEKWQLFARFLRACEVVRELQKKGGLRLALENQPLPPVLLAGGQDDSGGAAGASGSLGSGSSGGAAKGAGGTKGRAGGASAGSAADTKAAQSSPSQQTIYRFVADPKILNEVLAELSQQAPFQLAAQEDKLEEQQEEQAAKDRAAAKAEGAPAGEGPLGHFAQVFSSPLTVSSGSPVESAGGQPDERPAGRQRQFRNTVHTVLVLRSFRNMLDAVAQEQRNWDLLANNRTIDFLDHVPAHQRRPVLRTDWSTQKVPLLRPVISLSYGGRRYEITDPVDLAEGADSAEAARRGLPASDARWNRDVFRLLIDLSAQVSVDITKFQRPVLELSQ